jgi:Tfp pilus assembly protein PilO
VNRNRLMLIVAAGAAVLVVVGGFFLGVQPQLSAAAASKAQKATAEQTNAGYRTELERLRKANETLSEKKAELAVLQGSIPSSLSIAPFYKELGAIATTSGVSITTLTMSDAVAYAPPVAAEGTASSSEDTSTNNATASPSPSADASASATPTTPAAPAAVTNPLITGSNLSAVPVSVAVTGSLDQALAFTKGVQSGTRLFLVNQVGTAAATGSESGTTVTLSGYVYVLQDVAATQAEQATADAATNG